MRFVGVELEARATGTLDHQLLDDVLKRNVIGQIRPPDVFSLSVNADEAARSPRLSDGSVDFGQNLRRQSGQFVNLLNIRGRKSCWLASRTCDETGVRWVKALALGRHREKGTLGAFLAKRHVSPDV